MEKKNAFTYLLLVFSLTFLSCVTPPVGERPDVQKIDQQIIAEFDEAVEDCDFFAASKSYIEFFSCCTDARSAKMFSDIENLYMKKISEFTDATDMLSAVEYTYSLANMIEDQADEEKIKEYRGKLSHYIRSFVESDLASKGELEKISWILYLTGLAPNEALLYRALAEVFVERKNPYLAQKYLEKYREIPYADEESEKEAHSLEEKIALMKSSDPASGHEVSIEDSIKSSVKIMVDRGIKKEGGMAVPDQLLGTGVIIDERGYIITNYHIIESSVDPQYEGYSRVYVIPGKDETVRFVAKIVGYDSVFDLALLKIEKELKTFVKFGDSDLLRQGEKVLAIGNPLGLTNSVTSGVVSSVARPFLQIGNIIQIDAALNPGNSGGALINEKGYLVGIAFAGIENFENLNFAIPSNLLLSLLFRLYEGGPVQRSWFGCSVEKKEERISVDYIVPEGPAIPARIQVGDEIMAVNGKQVEEIFDIQNIVSNLSSPIVVRLSLKREEEVERRLFTLEERPEVPSLYVYEHDASENIITPLFGIVMNSVDPSRKKHYQIERVVKGSVASSVGLSEGDLIKIRGLKFDKTYEVFSLVIELKSKRFGYMKKNLVLYSYPEINTFI
jgi:S1-C subfamily serine protease